MPKNKPHLLTQEEKEEALLEDMKKNQVKARPLDPRVLMPPSRKALINTKAPTLIQPFNLSQGKRKIPTPEPVFKFKAQPVPLTLFKGTTGIPPKNVKPPTKPQSPVFNAKYPKHAKLEATVSTQNLLVHNKARKCLCFGTVEQKPKCAVGVRQRKLKKQLESVPEQRQEGTVERGCRTDDMKTIPLA